MLVGGGFGSQTAFATPLIAPSFNICLHGGEL